MRYLFLMTTLFFSMSAIAYDIQYKNLNWVRGSTPILKVELVGINEMESPKTLSNPQVIELRISTFVGCASTLAVDKSEEGTLKFLEQTQLAAQASCRPTIQYYWAPSDFKLSPDESRQMTLRIGPTINKSGTQNYLTVTATITKRIGAATVQYFEYSNVSIQ